MLFLIPFGAATVAARSEFRISAQQQELFCTWNLVQVKTWINHFWLVSHGTDSWGLGSIGMMLVSPGAYFWGLGSTGMVLMSPGEHFWALGSMGMVLVSPGAHSWG